MGRLLSPGPSADSGPASPSRPFPGASESGRADPREGFASGADRDGAGREEPPDGSGGAFLPEGDPDPAWGTASAQDPDPSLSDGGVLKAMLPPLPSPDDPIMPAEDGSFEDRVLLLLAAAVASHGLLTYPAYELAGDVVRRIFGDRALQSSFQARFHSALLHPPSRPEELALGLAREAVAEKVSDDQTRALLAGLEDLSRRGHADDMAHRLRESIDIAFAEEGLVRRRQRLDREGGIGRGLEQGARLGVRLGRVAMDGTIHLVQSMMGMAQKVLPGQGENSLATEEVAPPVASFNAATAASAEALARAAWTLGEEELRRELLEFRGTLADQTFRVVLVGEGKRGKSSLVNALLGEELSPVREAVPETAAVAEFFWAPRPRYGVRFLDEEQFTHLEEYLAGEEGNLFLRDKARTLRQRREEAAERPRGFAVLASRADIPDYLAVDGRYASLTGRVSIGLPLEMLRRGMVLVDTPGLNSTDSFQDYLAYEESLTADCLVFVMDARRPDSASELRLLRRLAAAGRAVSIIGVLTGLDRLNEAGSRAEARDRALAVLREGCRGAEGLRVIGLAAINARDAMEARCRPEGGRPSRQVREEWQGLLDLLRAAMAADAGKDGYRAKIAARSRQLAERAGTCFRASLDRYRASLPPAPFLELLERHADRLAEAAVSHAEQARSVVAAAAHDVELWRVEQSRALDAWEERLVLQVMDAASLHADALGSNFARESAWKAFDEKEAPAIARRTLEEFRAARQDVFRVWEQKIRLFQGELGELSLSCLRAVEAGSGELGDICSTTGRVDHLLVQTGVHMRNVALFLAGAGAGTAVTGGLLNLAALGGAALVVLTHPLALPGVALAGVAAYALHTVGNPARRRAAFLERKRKKTVRWAGEVRRQLEAELDAARDELAASYRTAVVRGFVPALEILAREAVHLRLYLDVMDRIREDADALERKTEELVLRLERAGDDFRPSAPPAAEDADSPV